MAFPRQTAERPSRGPKSETPILVRRPDLPGRFSDSVWNLDEADHHSGRAVSVCRIDWSDVATNHPGWLQTLRELCWHRLNTPLTIQTTISSYHAAREQMRTKRFLRWLSANHPDVDGPQQLTQRHIHEYRLWLAEHDEEDAVQASGANTRKTATCSPQTVWTYMLPIKALDLFRRHLSTPLSFSPYDGALSAKMLGAGRSNENETEPLPDEVVGPLISCARRYLEHYAPTVVGMQQEMHAFWETGRRDFPGWGFSRSTCPETGIQWMPAGKRRSHHFFREEMGHLVGACLVIILYLSGMRPGEVSNLEHECLSRPVDPATGLRDRWRITGIPLKKKRKGQGGKPIKVDWIVPEIVATAVQVLQSLLAPYRTMHGSNMLVLSKDGLRRDRQPTRARVRESKPGFPMSVTAMGSLISGFYARAQAHQAAIADADAQQTVAPTYHIKPSQFRRTLARYIARQPFGIIAGRLHYHHVSTAVFEGYAGSLSDTFALDVEDERILAGIDILEEMRSDAQAGWRAGPGAQRVLDQWEDVREVGIPTGVVDTSKQGSVLDNSVRKLVQSVHVGSLSYCVFNVSSALCLNDAAKARGETTPAISMCSPDKCANAVIAPCHVPRWQSLKDEADRLQALARNGPQRTMLRNASKRYGEVIDRARGGENGKG